MNTAIPGGNPFPFPFLKLFFFVILFVPLASRAQTNLQTAPEKDPPDGMVAIATNVYQGTNFFTELHWSDLRKSPTWDGNSSPPLGTSKAEECAIEYLTKRLRTFDPAESNYVLPPWEATWASIHRLLDSKHWYYEIKLQPLIDGSYNWDPVTMFVTMDGHVSPVLLQE